MSEPSQLFDLLKDPIRSRIMFEFMLNRRVTIKQLAELMEKDRTTINYHLKKFIDTGVIIQVDELTHTRGKPTIVYALRKNEYKIEKSTIDTHDEKLNTLLDLAKNLNMLSAVAEQTHHSVQAEPQEIQVENHMLLFSEDDVVELYQEIHETTRRFMEKKEMKEKEKHDGTDSDSKDKSNEIRYVIYSGLFPIIRNTQ